MIKTFLIIFTAALVYIVSSCSKATDNKKQTDTGTVVNIRLPKSVYKMYEPIELQYEWINNKNIPDSIWEYNLLFRVKHFITDDKGNTYSKQQREPDMLTGKPMVIKPGDTLLKTVSLNNFGNRYAEKLTKSYFWNDSYFPIGKYKVFAIIDEDINRNKYKNPIQTNEVEFEITALDNNDIPVLELVRQTRFEDALKLYPNSYFEECLMYADISKSGIEYIKAGEMNERYKDTSVLPVKYNAFFDKYPNSLYNLSDMHIIYYLRVSSRDSVGAQLKMNELLSKYLGTNISRTVNEIIRTQNRTGYSSIYIYIRGYHDKNGTSKEVIPQIPDKK